MATIYYIHKPVMGLLYKPSFYIAVALCVGFWVFTFYACSLIMNKGVL